MSQTDRGEWHATQGYEYQVWPWRWERGDGGIVQNRIDFVKGMEEMGEESTVRLQQNNTTMIHTKSSGLSQSCDLC